MAEISFTQKPNPLASALMKLWNSFMFFSTIALGFDVLVLKDAASLPFVAFGIIGLCIPTILKIIRAAELRKERIRKHEELLRTIELERLQKARIQERENLELERLYGKRSRRSQDAQKNSQKCQ